MTEVAAATPSKELSPEEERVLIRDIILSAEANAKEGDSFFLITQKWWQHWIEYVNQEQQQPNSNNEGSSSVSGSSDSPGLSTLRRPSGIDNSDLISDGTSEESSGGTFEIHDTLLEGRDYILLPHQVWNQLYSWYGGGPTLSRKVINSGLSQTEFAVEVYPLRLQLLVTPKGDHSTIRISKKVCIWDYYGHRKHALMNDMDKTLDDANLQMDQDILVEVLNDVNDTALSGGISFPDNGFADKEATSVLLEPSKSSLSIAGGLSANKIASKGHSAEQLQNQTVSYPSRELDNAYGNSGVITRGASGGLTGLLNLGNTCFMNSAIQCLVHTPEFARYFREDYHKEINWQNPLGMVGELALAFGELLRKLWAPGRTPVAPRPFKAKLARFAPQFSGYNQHDSQELLAFLLDGLHEDLNRVKHKPYINSKDADGRPDEEVADEYWANHIARNDSIIVDVCQGQYKSTLVCPVCNKVSVTFDPFMYLSLPLQFTTTRTMTITVFTCDGSAPPSTCTVTVPKQGRCRDLIQALSNACSLKQTEEIKLVEACSLNILICCSLKFTYLLKLSYLEISDAQRWKPFGTPLISSLSSDDVISSGDIQTIVQTMLTPLLKEGIEHTDNSDPSTSMSTTDPSDHSLGEVDSNRASTSKNKKVLPKLPLQLVDESKTCIDLSVGDEKAVNLSASSPIVVYFNWTSKLLGKYNMKHLETLPEVLKYGPITKKARTEPLSLYTCLEAFLREEPLVPEDMWYCPQCKEQRQASKKLDLWRLPEVLVIHLKRFSYSRSMKHKLETLVNFPIHDFDLTNYVADKRSSRSQLYELYALTNHFGGMGSGHYTAHIKLLDENRWYNFDDSHISPINEDEVKSAAAYVLFYRRVKSDASAGNAASSGRVRDRTFYKH
ncbi:Peptidase C19, ubiquitin carboxyl-terminal hydrolase 2 [Corchorus olitorius]|uniref:Ubiquitin carboxyl-terminal hydrolase n=1 Tax=Corchorus olitorius TaxID=93759 RepID=A0A1R3KKR9_9ROSI|nr:Peptidase C19, ubiquitin carboxyl-terminal hydrolase 2 [Corchorus olitorius]